MADQTAGDSVDQNQASGGGALDAQGVQVGDGDTAVGKAESRTFSPDDVERIVRERLARDRKDRPSDDELKKLRERAAKLDEIEAANQSELERAQKEAEDLRKEIETERAARNEASLRATVVAEAAKKNVVDPDAALALIDRTTLEFDDSGAPSNVPDVLDALLTARPYLVAQPETRGSADQGARTGGAAQVTEAQLKTMPWQEVEKARREGRLKNLLAPKG